MTEDEAKMKWCPFVRNLPGDPDGKGGADVPAHLSAYNRLNGTVAIGACIGSSCMAWRRNVAMFDRMTGEPAIPGVAAIGDLEPRYTAHGYCGLAGAPQ